MVFVFDTPQDCTRISLDELRFILDNTIQDNTDEEMCPKVPPYLAMAKSIKVWVAVIKLSKKLMYKGIQPLLLSAYRL